MVTSILFHIFLLLFISILKTLLLLLLLFYLTFLPFSQTISILCSHHEESCRLAKLDNMVTSILLLILLLHFHLHSKTLRHLHALLHTTSPFSSYFFIFSQKDFYNIEEFSNMVMSILSSSSSSSSLTSWKEGQVALSSLPGRHLCCPKQKSSTTTINKHTAILIIILTHEKILLGTFLGSFHAFQASSPSSSHFHPFASWFAYVMHNHYSVR